MILSGKKGHINVYLFLPRNKSKHSNRGEQGTLQRQLDLLTMLVEIFVDDNYNSVLTPAGICNVPL